MIDIAGWSICGGGWLKRFYCICVYTVKCILYMYTVYVYILIKYTVYVYIVYFLLYVYICVYNVQCTYITYNNLVSIIME